MPVCAKCGVEHDLLDPTFARPEAYVRLERAARRHAKADDDLCRITLPGTEPRYFVRGTMPVDVDGHPDGIRWGLWAEIDGVAFERILELWTNEDQASEPPFDGTLANEVPTYPTTLGLALIVRLTGAQTRPDFGFTGASEHPLVTECRAGITLHRAHEWNALIGAH